MNNITDIQEFRAKKMLEKADPQRTAYALMEVEDQILKLEQEYQEQRKDNEK